MRRVLASAVVVLAVVLAPAAAFAASTTLVISEVRTHGPNGANDEFVEIFNISSSAVNIGGFLKSSDSLGKTVTTIATLPSFVLQPKHFYLIVNAGSQSYSGTTAPDLTYTIGIPDDGGIAITNTAGTIIDAVGMSANSAFVEGNPLPPLTASVNQSYERNNGGCASTVDTDDNSSDFRFNPISSSPANSSASCAAIACAGVVCNSPSSACFTIPGACSGGSCSYMPLAQGATCTDGNACTGGDKCDATQNCVGAAVVCNTPPANSCTDANTLLTHSAAGTCSMATGC
ncbi:MAG TPA: lamin tail domain-containing protein, partial [Polyangiaceae bacterium]|nr:lamin tail domain-containing protein [Polyangiaceae bacterium]